MMISLAPPLAFRYDGQRTNNEDVYWPTQPDPITRLFLVCDGMGGWDGGEVASQLVAETIAHYAEKHPADQMDDAYLEAAVLEAHQRLTDYITQHPMVSRLGTTLALLHFGEYGATVAHIGDSRVYHIRDGQVLFCTNDHRQVADLVSEGIITEEQAKTHPWRNRLSRSVAAERPAAPGKSARKPDRADLSHLIDISPGDYFFLCTDGVLEQITDEILTACLATEQPDDEKLVDLLAHCEGKTQDNYTGLLIRVADVQDADEPEEDASAVDERLDESDDPTDTPRRGFWKWLVLTALLTLWPVITL